MRRAARDADGWYGWGLDLEQTSRYIAILTATSARVKRRDGLRPLEITITPPGDVDKATATRYADLGVHRLNLMLPWHAAEAELAEFFGRVVEPLARESAGGAKDKGPGAPQTRPADRLPATRNEAAER